MFAVPISCCSTNRACATWAVVACLVAAPSIADSATIRVPLDQPTIESAIASASADDIILVSSGTYEVEANIPIPLTLRGESGAKTTILSGNDMHRILDVTADLTLEGLTLQFGGDGNPVAANDYQGGAMRVLPTDLEIVIDNCVFFSNKAGSGGGVYCRSSITVTNCEFLENGNGQEFPHSTTGGGGLWTDNTAVVENCTFRTNRSASGAGFRRLGPTTVRNCHFEDNQCNGSGGGIGMSVNAEPITIEACTFVDNYASRGAGALVVSDGTMTVSDCEFVDNLAGLAGGGLYAAGSGSFELDNCRFVGNKMTNTAAVGGAGLVLTRLRGGATIRNCFFKDNVNPNPSSRTGGGAVWMNESAEDNSPQFYDCAFVDNESQNGPAVVVVRTGDGPDRPLFERCLFGYNRGDRVIGCTVATTKPAQYILRCSILTSNDNNMICGISDTDVLVIDEDSEDPVQIFCDSEHDRLCADSAPWRADCGPMGGLMECPGCLTPIQHSTWSDLKSTFAAPQTRKDEQ